MELDELKHLLQDHFTDGLVTVIGSGLSCAEGLPGMVDLASHLQRVMGPGLSSDDTALWATLSPLIVANGLEAALLKCAPTPTLETAIVSATADLIARRERQVITDVFARKKTLRFSRLVNHLLKPPTGLPVITINYDRLIEIAVEEAGLGADTMFVGDFAGVLNERESRFSFCRDATMRGRNVHFLYQQRVKIFKPHGSLDWYHRDGNPVRYSGDLALPRLIITPGLNKFRNGYDSPFDQHRDRANSAIDRAARFLIIGYGFNDDHLETHLTPRIRSGVKTLLLARTLSPGAATLAKQCANVVAIQRAMASGKDGSSVFVEKTEFQIPRIALWELGTFISEVLEP